ncbi:putative high affinity immunoglobulin gamma Fc receptor IB [Mixophyes fleayi]|uniref:putative high affinity immunoglobulin gamma Fc receptor IB n=1 Tax=Mixophyes fleayi TaxID=3061075 RepID=UPI003F4D7841
MSVLTFIILTLSVMKNSGDAVRPLVTFTPNWENVLEGDSVTLSGNVRSTERVYKYYWYKDDVNIKYVQEYTITSAKKADSGDYQCWTGTGAASYPARLYVHSKDSAVRPVVTFTPNWRKIFTKETVTLTCDVGSTAEGTQRYYWYRNNNEMSSTERDITITSATEQDSGDYQCSTGNGILNYPVRLEVNAKAYLILQAPPSIFEGGPIDAEMS